MEEEQKHRSRKRKRRKKRRQITGVVFLSVAIVLVLGIYAVTNATEEIMTNEPNAKIDDAEKIPVEPVWVPDVDDREEIVQESEIKEGIEAIRYYDESLKSRYEAFRILHPGLTDDEICWMVGCNLDLEPYKTTFEVPDPDDYLLLVNKYYNLPADYEPSDLISVGSTKMRKDAGEAMTEMISVAKSEGLALWSQSGYRDYNLQKRLFNNYSEQDGIEQAETYSARPGHSEHQTGLTTDFNTITQAFGDTPEGKWAAENCWSFGFIVRYTEENRYITLYKSEPWHMRYIGKEAAEKMREENILSFEEYWVKHVKQ